MTSIIKLEALSGVQDEGPLCYLLQVDDFHFLLDCGWDESFDLAYVETLKRKAANHQIDAVLLSYGDIPHLGALPYLMGKCGFSCPVYATVPVYKMGQMFLYDWFLGHSNVEDFDLFTLDDIDSAFEKVQQLKYNQQVSLKGRGHGLQITPIAAGHMIGGTIWRITKMGEEEIVYAVDFNHKKERHLNGCSFEGISRPNLLITDAYNATYKQTRMKDRDEELLTNILRSLRNGGDVLLVLDTAGRVLEVAHLLDQLWHNADAGLSTYSLVVMSNVAYNVVEFAKSQVEWMSDKILKTFEDGRYNPFQFRHAVISHKLSDLNRVRSPKVVLASEPDMESGFSREIFLEWCADSKNSIIVTSRSSPRTLASKLIHMATGGPEVSRHLNLEIKRKIPLEGSELDEYWREKKAKEHEAARLRMEQQRRSSRIETVESSDDSDVEELDIHQSDHPYDILWKWEQQQKSSFFKQAKKTYPMYPYTEEKIKWDDYGEIIRPEDYMLTDSSVLPSSLDMQQQQQQDRDEDDRDSQDGTIQQQQDLPSKYINSKTKLEVLCQVAFIDFEGRSDGDSVKKILQQIKPKQLIIVHGSKEATRHLASYCELHKIAEERIFTPRIGEIVDATIESHIYQVTVTDVLMSSLEFQPVKDAELAWVDARLSVRKSGASDMMGLMQNKNKKTVTFSAFAKSIEGYLKDKEKDDNTSKDVEMGGNEGDVDTEITTTTCLETLPFNSIPPHVAVFVNDPKLSDLKQLLMVNGFQAEFKLGVLYVNNVISIRRNEAGRFQLEGSTSDDYYKIRDLIYKQFAIV